MSGRPAREGVWSKVASVCRANAAGEGSAAADANGGQLMEPTFLQKVTDPDGRTTEELDPEEQSEVISE